ncbi:hypothetical protein B0A55_12853 [Friedmanniomyces simplex]|uniref:Carbohydrate kinase PfkB domain-containing protein n=1 Tax=Friedmanniomyces simplex TaxID=329884 RepID=A0A4U0VU61_9PEZI|nr:hypothetical protein B0A55_12853 [Friedmanniomyces simplex]
MSRTNLVVLGGINIDLVMTTARAPAAGESKMGTSLGKYVGGKAANVAMAAYRASHGVFEVSEEDSTAGDTASTARAWSQDLVDGVSVYLNGAVGQDSHGIWLLEQLALGGVDVSQVQRIAGEETATAMVIVETTTGESRGVAFYGAGDKWKMPDGTSISCMATGSKPDLVICQMSVPRNEVFQVLAAATREGVDTILNPSPALELPDCVYANVTHLVMNQSEAALLCPRGVQLAHGSAAHAEVADWFLQLGVKNVIVTLAAEGAYYATNAGLRGLVEAEKDVKVVDATGAGDTFLGAYAVEYIRQKREGKWVVEKAVHLGCKAAARKLTHSGAQEYM